MRSLGAILFLLSLCAYAETSQIVKFAPDVQLYPGDSVYFDIDAVFTGQTQNNANAARIEIKETSTKGERTLLSTFSDGRRGSANLRYQFQVPAQYCFECPGRVYRITRLVLTVDLYTVTNGVRIASSQPRTIDVTYPVISGMTPASVPLQSEFKAASATVNFSGFAPLTNAGPFQLWFRHTTDKAVYTATQISPPVSPPVDCPVGEPSGSLSLFYPCSAQISGESVRFGFVAYDFGIPPKPAAKLGTYDVVVMARPPARTYPPNTLAPSQADAILPAAFTVVAPIQDDEIRLLKVSLSGGGKPIVDLPQGVETPVDMTPGILMTVTSNPQFKLSREGYGILWSVVRDKTTGTLLRAYDRYVVNTRGAFATSAYSFNLGSVGTAFTVPANENPLEFYLALTPLMAKFDDPYDESKAFAFSPKITFKRGDPGESVPSGAGPARQQTDTRFVTASGPGVKTPCRKRTPGPLEINIDIDRVVGETDANGRLEFPSELIDSGVLSNVAKLRIASFGRRLQGGTTRKDRVYFNDIEVDSITGGNEQWVTYQANVNMRDVKFASREPGKRPAPRGNRLRIEIDQTDSTGPENWCTSVAWAELAFNALAPIVFVHGNGQGDDNNGGAFWEGGVLDTATAPRLKMGYGFVDPLKDKKIPYNNSISMLTDSTEAHGDLLKTLIPDAAAEFGARHAHIVTHSKGALDSRQFLASTMPENFGVYSIHTVAGPHKGSSGPDYQIDAVKGSIADSDDSTRAIVGYMAEPNKGTESLRVSTAAAFNFRNVPYLPKTTKVDGVINTVQYRSVSADMNDDDSTNPITGNPTIELNEAFGLPGQGAKPDLVWESIMQTCYRITGEVISTNLEKRRVFRGNNDYVGTEVWVVKENLSPVFRKNDIAVTHDSSRVGPFEEVAHVKANHSSIAGPTVANLVLASILRIQDVSQPVP